MEFISDLKTKIFIIYANLENYINPVLKFILMLVSVLLINGKLGFMDKLTNIVIVLGVCIISAFLPLNVEVVISALFILLHMYSLSLQVAAIVGIVFAVMFVLYFRFSPKDAVAVMITPILFTLKLPYLGALLVGFLGGPLSFISVSCGTVVYYMVDYVGNNSDKFKGSFSADNALSGFKTIIDSVLNNDTMIVMVVTLAVVAVLTNVIKRLSMDYSWYIALAASAIVGLIVVVIGSSAMDADVSIAGAIVSMLISAVITFIVQLFIHDVDYSRTEYVQFEDDEYVYYVKAIPKVDPVPSRRPTRRRPKEDY